MSLIHVTLGLVATAASGLNVRRSSEALGMCSLEQDMLSELGAQRDSTRCNAYSTKSHGAPGVDYVSFIHTDTKVGSLNRHDGADRGKDYHDQVAVWVSGYPRSGSSTMLSMVSATMDNNQDPGHVFSLFEPCHDGDEFKESRQSTECGSVLKGLSRCNFHGIEKLWGWWDPHSTNNHTKFEENLAHELCTQADIVAFKTVDYGHALSSWKWLLDSHPSFRVLDIVRDPRGIYTSWKELEPFKSLVEAGEFYTITDICRNFANNLDYHDPRVHRVIFEDLMTTPHKVTKDVYEFLDLHYGERQEKWVQDVFNNSNCPPPPPELVGFTDCHASSVKSTAEKWRSVLSEKELQEYRDSASCQRVAKAYGYKD